MQNSHRNLFKNRSSSNRVLHAHKMPLTLSPQGRPPELHITQNSQERNAL